MDRCAVLVDAGYLLGAAGTLLARDPERARLVVDYPSLVAALITEAEKQTALPVLRMLWYDGAVRGQPTPEHRTLRVLPDVKVRLGETVRRGGRLEQKGVDSYLQRDLTTLARNRAVSDVVLVGGDEDLRRGLEEAQDYGVRVHLWGVEAAEPEYNQSQALIAEADRRWVISAYWVRQYVSLAAPLDSPEPLAGYQVASRPSAAVTSGDPGYSEEGREVPADDLQSDEFADEVPAVNDREPEVPASITGTPADLARLPHPPHGPSHARPSARTQTTVRQLPRLRDLTTPAQAWQDNEADALAATGDPVQTGATFGERWASRATRSQYEELLAQRPMLPNRIDGELLRYADRLGMDTRENELAKHIVRDSFWEGVLSTTPREDPPPAGPKDEAPKDTAPPGTGTGTHEDTASTEAVENAPEAPAVPAE